MQGRRRQLKGDSLWRKGIFLGKSVSTNEFVFGTQDRIYTARLCPFWLGGPRRLGVSGGGGKASTQGSKSQ